MSDSKQILIEMTKKVGEHVASSIVPLYTIEKETRPSLVGSSVYIQILGKYLLITASHVVDEISNEKLLMHINDKEIGSVPAEYAYSFSDKVDISFMLLREELLIYRPLNFSDCMDIQKFKKTSKQIAIGYPKGKTEVSTRKTYSESLTFVTQEVDDATYKKYDFNREDQILVNFHRNNILRQDLSEGKSVHPRGMSGGGLFSIEEDAFFKCEKPKLSGILVAWDSEKSETLASTNISYALQGIIEAMSLIVNERK